MQLASISSGRNVSTLTDLTESLIDYEHRFRWVEVQLDVFLNKRAPILHPKDVQIKLDILQRDTGHPSLESVYCDLFAVNTQGQDHKRSLVTKALQLVLCSLSPLSMEGLVQAVAHDADGNVDPFMNEAFLLQIGNNFIRVTKNGTVKFAHRSVKEYLVRSGKISRDSGDVQAAEICQGFLLSFKDESKWGHLPTRLLQDARGLNLTIFEMYACFFWASHYEQVTSECERLHEMVAKFLSMIALETNDPVPSIAFQRWISLLCRVFSADYPCEGLVRQRLEDAISFPPHPIFTACIWGFESHVSKLVRYDRKLTGVRNHRGKSCLYLACEHGNRDVVRTLIENGADVDQCSDHWGTGLQAAASSGNLETFEEMLQRGASVNLPINSHGRTLDAAISGANAGIVMRALEEGVDVCLECTDKPVPPVRRQLWVSALSEESATQCLLEGSSDYGKLRQFDATHGENLATETQDEDSPKCDGLLERLRKANMRRRELLASWNIGHERSLYSYIADECVFRLAILHEPIMKHPTKIPLPEGFPSKFQCPCCFQRLNYATKTKAEAKCLLR